MSSDSSEIRLTLSDFNEHQRAELEEALQSERLQFLHLYFDNYDGISNLNVFLHALEIAPKHVVLRGTPTLLAVTGQFLDVIARNSNIRMLVLDNLVFPAEQLTSLLQRSDSVDMLVIQGCQAIETPGHWEDNFLRALNFNKVLRTLDIGDSDVAYLAPIAEQLGHHPTLVHLVFSGPADEDQRVSPSIATLNVIRSILKNGTSSSVAVSCENFKFEREDFIPIARGAMHGKLNNGLNFSYCSFDEASTKAFETMFEPSSNLRSLRLNCPSIWFTKPTQAMMGSILRQDSPLKKLTLHGMASHEEGGNVMTAVMKALEVNTSLRYLRIDDGVEGEVVEALKNGLPKLRGLECLVCPGLLLDEAQRSSMLEEFKRNNSIRKTFGVLEAFPREEDKKKLLLHAARNQNIPELIENPARLPLLFWSKVFKIAQDCEYGADSVFRALLASADRIFIIPEA